VFRSVVSATAFLLFASCSALLAPLTAVARVRVPSQPHRVSNCFVRKFGTPGWSRSVAVETGGGRWLAGSIAWMRYALT